MPKEERKKIPQNNLGVKKKSPLNFLRKTQGTMYNGDKYMWLILQRRPCYKGGNIRRIHFSEDL